MRRTKRVSKWYKSPSKLKLTVYNMLSTPSTGVYVSTYYETTGKILLHVTALPTTFVQMEGMIKQLDRSIATVLKNERD